MLVGGGGIWTEMKRFETKPDCFKKKLNESNKNLWFHPPTSFFFFGLQFPNKANQAQISDCERSINFIQIGHKLKQKRELVGVNDVR